MTPAMRRAVNTFVRRFGSRLAWGPCHDCGRVFGVSPSDVVDAVRGEVVCRDCSPGPLLDKAAVLTERQRYGCRSTR